MVIYEIFYFKQLALTSVVAFVCMLALVGDLILTILTDCIPSSCDGNKGGSLPIFGRHFCFLFGYFCFGYAVFGYELLASWWFSNFLISK